MRGRENGTARAGARCAAGPMLSIWLSFGEMPQKSTKTRTSMTMLSCDAMGSWAMLSAYAKPDTANLRGIQIFNPTSMCAYATVFDAISSAVLREPNESNRFVQKSAESTSI